MANYVSKFTGPEIDTAVENALNLNAALVRQEPVANGHYILDAGKTYQIKNSAASGEWGFGITLQLQFSHPDTGNLHVETAQLELPAFELFTDGMEFRIFGLRTFVDTISSGKYQCNVLVQYILNGDRNSQLLHITCNTNPGWPEFVTDNSIFVVTGTVIGATDVLLINDAVPVTAAPGKSAYEYAVDGGYTGSEEDFAKLIAGITSPGGGGGTELSIAELNKVIPNGFGYTDKKTSLKCNLQDLVQAQSDDDITMLDVNGVVGATVEVFVSMTYPTYGTMVESFTGILTSDKKVKGTMYAGYDAQQRNFTFYTTSTSSREVTFILSGDLSGFTPESYDSIEVWFEHSQFGKIDRKYVDYSHLPVRGEMLQGSYYYTEERSIDELNSPSDVGFYTGDGYSLIVTYGDAYGDFSCIHQIKISNTFSQDSGPTISTRQYCTGTPYTGWSAWTTIGGSASGGDSGGVVIGQLESYHHDNGYFVDDNLKTEADIGIYQGDDYTLFVTSTDSSYMPGGQLVNQLKFTYEGNADNGEVKPALYHRIYTSSGWSSWEKVGGESFQKTVTPEEVDELYGDDKVGVYHVHDSDSTVEYGSLGDYPLIVLRGDTEGDGPGYYIERWMQIKIVDDRTYKREFNTYNYTWSNWSTFGGTTLYEHVYSFVSNREDVFTISWTDRYNDYNPNNVDTILSKLYQRYKGEIFMANGVMWSESAPDIGYGHIIYIKVGSDSAMLTPYYCSSSGSFSSNTGYDSDSLTLLSHSDRACS